MRRVAIAPLAPRRCHIVRMNRLENQVRQLRGQIEQLQYENRQLKEQVRKFQEDVEFRFQDGARRARRRPARAHGRATPRGSAAATPADSRPPAPTPAARRRVRSVETPRRRRRRGRSAPRPLRRRFPWRPLPSGRSSRDHRRHRIEQTMTRPGGPLDLNQVRGGAAPRRASPRRPSGRRPAPERCRDGAATPAPITTRPMPPSRRSNTSGPRWASPLPAVPSARPARAGRHLMARRELSAAQLPSRGREQFLKVSTEHPDAQRPRTPAAARHLPERARRQGPGLRRLRAARSQVPAGSAPPSPRPPSASRSGSSALQSGLTA